MATLVDFGVKGAGGEILQPHLKNKWKLTFNGIGNLVSSEVLTLQAITCDRPKISHEVVQLDRYNSRAYIAGKYTFEPITITLEADVGGLVEAAIRAQEELQQRIIGLGSAPRLPAALAGADYKFSITQSIMDGDDLPLSTFYIEGAWLENVDWGDLDYAASETLKITLTVRYDHARQDINGVQKLAMGGHAPIL
ncbi:hypothetical protein [Stenotrophomonas phage RAS14]